MSVIIGVAPLLLTQSVPPRVLVDRKRKFHPELYHNPEGRLRSQKEVTSIHRRDVVKKCWASTREATATTRNESAGPRAPGRGADLPRGQTEHGILVRLPLAKPHSHPSTGAAAGGSSLIASWGVQRTPGAGTVTTNGEGSGLQLPSTDGQLSGPHKDLHKSAC